MIRLFRFLLVGTLIFHVVTSTYRMNILEQKLSNITVAINRLPPNADLSALKKDVGRSLNTLDSLSAGYAKPPHWGQR